jgi:hypothetical protein
MEKLLTVLKRVATALPYLTFLTVFLYLAGREFNAKYWRGVGLPLMATDRQFADMLYDGFLGYLLWASSLFGPRFSPTLTILIFSAIAAALYRVVQLGAARAGVAINKRWGSTSSKPIGPKAMGVLDEIEASGGYFTMISLTLLSIPILVGMTALAPALPTLALGGQGFVQGKKDIVLYEARLRQLRDGLVDVSIVSVKRGEGEKPSVAIPMECSGDRCAAMTQDGPISLPKDRFSEESVVRAEVTEACFSTAGLERYRMATLAQR